MTPRFLIIAAAFVGASSMTFSQVAPVAGDIAVTEIMFNPGPEACVTDANGEHFEITNISCKALDLNGIYVEDRNTTTGLPSTFGFQVLASVATLPTLYPGQSFVFARNNNSAVNGGIPVVHYPYAAATAAPPVDKSQVGSSQMMINNSGLDGLFVAVGGFASGGGMVIETVNYNASAVPLTPNAGLAAERVDPFSVWLVSGVGNDNNNCAQSTSTYGACSPANKGTAGATNSTTNIVNWPTNSTYDGVSCRNTGILTAPKPVSVGAGSVTFKGSAGLPLAGQIFTFGYSDDVPSEYCLSLFLPGNPGSILLDLLTIGFIDSPTFVFDVNGDATFDVPVPNDITLIGKKFLTQWLSFDPMTFVVIASNVARVEVCE